MTRDAAHRLARTNARCWLVAALVTPLLLVGGTGTPDVAATLLACALALVAATGAVPVVASARRVAQRGGGPPLALPVPSSRIPDPVHHPVSPRAPGLV